MTAEPIDSASLDKMIAFLSILGHLEIIVCSRCVNTRSSRRHDSDRWRFRAYSPIRRRLL